ncbi:MAG: hypothetical protein ACK4EY_08765 [Flavipsychrobacter sp.]
MRYIPIILAAVLCSCGNSTKNNNSAKNTAVTVPTTDTLAVKDSVYNDPNTTSDDYANYYLVVADTGTDYYTMDAAMYRLAKQSHMDIDTLNRYYNAKKKKIVLREDDADEAYAGEYISVRFPNTNFSIEYLDSYTIQARKGTMCILAGIYETQQAADSVLRIIKPNSPKAFTMKSKIYIGCIH